VVSMSDVAGQPDSRRLVTMNTYRMPRDGVNRRAMSEPMALIADRYRLQHVVGSGGMGVVWQAWDERLERTVALKQLHRQSGTSPAAAELANKRAMREARLTARLSHPHAVPVFDVVEQEGQLWLIMQFIPSITLAAVLEEAGPLQPDEAAHVGAEVASALTAAHAVGIVHRDVKPRNILIAEDGTALISDFGIAHALGDATLTTRGMIHGTPAYLAPEVARGNEANFASDVFSLGATLYSAMEGSPPFGTDENSMALLHRVASGQFPPPQHSGVVTPVILEMLSTDPEARPSMRTVADSLARLAAGSRPSAGEETPTSPAPVETTTADAVDAGLATTAPSPSSVPSPAPKNRDQDSTEPQRKYGLAAAVAIVVVFAIGILIAVLTADPAGSPAASSGQSTAAAPESTNLSSAPQAPSASTKPQRPSSTATSRTGARTPAPDPSRSASPRTKARRSSQPQSPTTPPTTPRTVRGTPTAAQLRRAITSYYALMPGNTDAAWPRMTASYQTNHAGGRQAYQRFWDAIDRVSVADVSGIPPRSARATITYYFKDGRVVRERTAYGLVNEGGRLKISSTTVLSSVTL
jgi:eukaryotic-like serine/threonine-protein kinase